MVLSVINKSFSIFQRFCFKSPLPAQGLLEVKNIVRKNIDDGLDEHGLTFDGEHFFWFFL